MRKEAVHIFFEFLSNKELSATNLEEEIYSWSPEDLLDFMESCQELLPTTSNNASSIFEFSANSQLSGLPSPCAAIDCRMENIESMARFAILYSDRILLRNPFEGYYNFTQVDDDIYERVANDLRVIYYIKPLIEEGFVEFVDSPSPKSHFCLQCYEKILFSQPEHFGERLSEIKKILISKYIDNADFFVEQLDNIRYIVKENRSDVVDDAACAYIIEKLSRGIEKKLKNSDVVKLSKKEVLSSNIIDHYVAAIIEDIAIQNWCSNIYGTSYLTNRRIDLELISNSPDQEIYNKALLQSFSHYLPIIQDTTFTNLIRIREDEGESFLVYRDALKQALKIASSSGHQELASIFNDIVQPEINKINSTVKKKRQLLLNSLFSDLILSAGFMSIGVFSGFLPPNIRELMTALGGFKFISGLKDKLSELIQEPESVTSNKFYFLWKAKKKLS